MGNATLFGNYEFELTGGALCLDFANTMPDQKVPETRAEKLLTYSDLLSWAVQTGQLTASDARKLMNAANHSQAKASAALRRARELRQAIYSIFSAIARESAPATKDLDVLNRFWKNASIHASVSHAGGKFQKTWVMDEDDALDRPLWPVAVSAADLLTSEDLAMARECASDRCSWLFLDNSRNKSRRWCDMKTCGNREKAKRHYEKSRG
ncbi:MAG: ABATE domain-containing protein [Terriglobia bacterium]|jgi:predicted RNA-binding Zn ribbon-like protein|nr:ABATE domain-containing protein [Terriglobia bacterium]